MSDSCNEVAFKTAFIAAWMAQESRKNSEFDSQNEPYSTPEHLKQAELGANWAWIVVENERHRKQTLVNLKADETVVTECYACGGKLHGAPKDGHALGFVLKRNQYCYDCYFKLNPDSK